MVSHACAMLSLNSYPACYSILYNNYTIACTYLPSYPSHAQYIALTNGVHVSIILPKQMIDGTPQAGPERFRATPELFQVPLEGREGGRQGYI